MRFSVVFLTATSLLSTSVLAGRDAPTPVVRAIEARDTAACASAASQWLSELDSTLPTPTGDVLTYLVTATLTDQCAIPTVTGDLGSSLSSYASTYSKWQSDHLPELRSIYHACSDVPQITSQLTAAFASASGSACSTILAQITGTGGTGNAAPRETGMPLAAVALVAGIAAVIM